MQQCHLIQLYILELLRISGGQYRHHFFVVRSLIRFEHLLPLEKPLKKIDYHFKSLKLQLISYSLLVIVFEMGINKHSLLLRGDSS